MTGTKNPVGLAAVRGGKSHSDTRHYTRKVFNRETGECLFAGSPADANKFALAYLEEHPLAFLMVANRRPPIEILKGVV